MKPIPINLAVEDILSEAVLHRLLRQTGKQFEIGAVFQNGGFGYLKNKCNGWNKAAKSIPLLLLTDLDKHICVRALLDDWDLQNRHANFLIRVAVREVEAWLLGDKNAIAKFLSISQANVSDEPEALLDPKQYLINLARKCRRTDLRKALVPKEGSTATQGPDYNRVLIEFVNTLWDPEVAAGKCPSLDRCVRRLSQFQPTWNR